MREKHVTLTPDDLLFVLKAGLQKFLKFKLYHVEKMGC